MFDEAVPEIATPDDIWMAPFVVTITKRWLLWRVEMEQRNLLDITWTLHAWSLGEARAKAVRKARGIYRARQSTDDAVRYELTADYCLASGPIPNDTFAYGTDIIMTSPIVTNPPGTPITAPEALRGSV